MDKIFVTFIVMAAAFYVVNTFEDKIISPTSAKIAYAPVEGCSGEGQFDECQKYLDKNHTNYYYRVACKATAVAPEKVCLFTNFVDPGNQDPYQTSAPVPRVNDGGYCDLRVTGTCYNVCIKFQSKLASHDGRPYAVPIY